MKIILTELIANKKNLFLATQMIKEEKFLNNWVKMPNTAATNEKSLKLIYFFNCCIKYLIKKVAFYRVCIFSIQNCKLPQMW